MSIDSRRSGTPSPETEASADDEQKMRRALGLTSGVSRGEPRGRTPGRAAVVVHRNGRNGEPPVNRIAEAQTALAAERLAREQAEAAARTAEAALKESDTRRAHAELTRDEALAALAEERSARQAIEAQLQLLTPAPEAEPGDPATTTPLPRRRGRPPKVRPEGAASAVGNAEVDSPVEWWVPGWRERMARAG